MRSERAVILFVRDERLEGAAKHLPGRYRAHGYGALNRSIAGRLKPLLLEGVDLVVIAEGSAPDISGSHFLAQRGATFGERISNAIDDTLALGYRDVVVVGNDCPTITPSDLSAAFARLRSGAGYVAAPTCDGGAFLIGTRRGAFDAVAFEELPWQTGSLFRALIALEGAAHLSILREDFDSWQSVSALRQLAILLAERSEASSQRIPPAPSPTPARMKALSRLYHTAPPSA